MQVNRFISYCCLCILMYVHFIYAQLFDTAIDSACIHTSVAFYGILLQYKLTALAVCVLLL